MNQKDLAKKRLSSAHLSRVINNEGHVSEKTTQKVLNAMGKYGCVQNTIVRNLRMVDSK